MAHSPSPTASRIDDELGVRTAIEQAKQSYAEGGIPIGATLIYHGDDARYPRILGAGHNKRVQQSSPTLHGEIAALENAGRLKHDAYRSSTMYTTLSPCSMCTGAILLYRIPRVVVGENKNFKGDEGLLRARGVEVVVLDNEECINLMQAFIRDHPEEWYEDIGEISRNPVQD